MAALSPAHFLLWTRLTTASRAPSVTPSKEQICETGCGCLLRHKPRALSVSGAFSWTIREQTLETVRACVHSHKYVCRSSPSCLELFAQLAGSPSISLPLCFTIFSHTFAFIPSASSCPTYQESRWGHELKETSTWHTTNKVISGLASSSVREGSCSGKRHQCQLAGYTTGDNLLCTLSKT